MISVVVPAYNEEKIIARCLNSLVSQKTNKEFEVILVNNNSTDKTDEIAQTFKKKLKLRIILEPKQGRGVARHTGFMKASGNIILSTDADAVVTPDWVEVLSGLMTKPGVVAATGTCWINDCSYMTNKSFNLFQPLFMRGYRLLFGHYWLSGFSFGIYKEIYEKSGGFNTKLNAQEDIDLSFKVSKLGKIYFFPDHPVLFSGRRFKKGFVRGLYPYLATFFDYYFFKRNDFTLPDVR